MKGLTRDRKKMLTKPIVCSKCGTSGGTLHKVDDHYECSDTGKCKVMQLRVPVPLVLPAKKRVRRKV